MIMCETGAQKLLEKSEAQHFVSVFFRHKSISSLSALRCAGVIMYMIKHSVNLSVNKQQRLNQTVAFYLKPS